TDTVTRFKPYLLIVLQLPSFFSKVHDYTMYSNDLEFINGLINTKTRGLLVYQLTLSLWRVMCVCYYSKARLEVLKLTKHSEDGTVKARWRIIGLPFYSQLLRFYRKDKSQLYRSYDAFSTFYIGPDGLIHCHKVETVSSELADVLRAGADTFFISINISPESSRCRTTSYIFRIFLSGNIFLGKY
ncbi:uncharacterized protein C6orf136 homolog, partial [Notothenia coriiceps]|uniref:Uncharacterized protein C6orf136 homolog n=1 Tax=Notothenia coriiceps TaxID=8208 RepID=A0A6I9NDW9_9TELE